MHLLTKDKFLSIFFRASFKYLKKHFHLEDIYTGNRFLYTRISICLFVLFFWTLKIILHCHDTVTWQWSKIFKVSSHLHCFQQETYHNLFFIPLYFMCLCSFIILPLLQVVSNFIIMHWSFLHVFSAEVYWASWDCGSTV